MRILQRLSKVWRMDGQEWRVFLQTVPSSDWDPGQVFQYPQASVPSPIYNPACTAYLPGFFFVASSSWTWTGSGNYQAYSIPSNVVKENVADVVIFPKAVCMEKEIENEAPPKPAPWKECVHSVNSKMEILAFWLCGTWSLSNKYELISVWVGLRFVLFSFLQTLWPQRGN